MDRAEFIEYLEENSCCPCPGHESDMLLWRNPINGQFSAVPIDNRLLECTAVRILKTLGVAIPEELEDLGHVMDAVDRKSVV